MGCDIHMYVEKKNPVTHNWDKMGNVFFQSYGASLIVRHLVTNMGITEDEGWTILQKWRDGEEPSNKLEEYIIGSYIPKNIEFGNNIAYAHITGNNTIYGTEYHNWPNVSDEVPLVCDMSSNIMDKVIDFNKFGVIYAGAQKNIGPAGVTLVIVRDDLLERVPEKTPTMQKWKTHSDKDSLFNTAPCWAIYMCKLSLEYLKQKGGISNIEKINRKKAELLYDFIDNSNGFYKGYAMKDSRSLMNVTFNLPTKDLEEKCVLEGSLKGLLGLKGHRSIGGMRASIYNAMTIDGVKKLIEFLKEFQEENQ